MGLREKQREINEIGVILNERKKYAARDIQTPVPLEKVLISSFEDETTYICLTTINNEKAYFYAPSSLIKVFEAELEECSGDIDTFNSSIALDNIKVYFNKEAIKDGKTYIRTILV